jgi:hypothetical protein
MGRPGEAQDVDRSTAAAPRHNGLADTLGVRRIGRKMSEGSDGISTDELTPRPALAGETGETDADATADDTDPAGTGPAGVPARP